MKKPTTVTLSPVEWDESRDVLKTVTQSSLATSKAARLVFDEMRSGNLSVADATELNNALGKVIGADSNAVKATLTLMALDKIELTHATKNLEALQ